MPVLDRHLGLVLGECDRAVKQLSDLSKVSAGRFSNRRRFLQSADHDLFGVEGRTRPMGRKIRRRGGYLDQQAEHPRVCSRSTTTRPRRGPAHLIAVAGSGPGAPASRATGRGSSIRSLLGL